MKKAYFDPVTPQVSFPEIEERVLAYWKENKIFEKSIETRPKDKTWTFLDGPPFITGLPHYGTLLSSIPKDVFPRYWTMKGNRVRRVWGWDCHGLPAENKVEEKLGIKRKKDIEEKIGVKRFIDECKLYVKNVSSEWEWYVDHVGRWVDFKNAYRTMDLPYMETVMWVFREMYDKGFIYKGLRVSLYCPHCATPISNFEVAMDPDNYQTVTEPAATFMYQLRDEPDTYLLAWSTTPWNKIVTPALAVNPRLTYVKVAQDGRKFILAKGTMKILKGDSYEVLEEFTGKALVGKSFVPHYDFYRIEPGKRAFVVVPGDFVTAEEGTGVVTIAAYGEEDLAVMLAEDIQLVLHLDEEGLLKGEVPRWAGKYYLDVDPLVIADLGERGLVYRVDPYTHPVPTCWRCHTRLIYAPQDAWYVNVQKLKPVMAKTNEAVNWFPAHFKYGRFRKSMEAAPDWCISRSRFWGSPVPVWECECRQRFVPGSISELEGRSGQKISDLHKPDIDGVTVTCEKCGKMAHRVPEVLDSWIEAGSASFAERHFPFEKGTKLEDFFPPDFIVEYTGQIRAWFYVLHVIAAALYEFHAFKKVMVTGVILGTDGRKMSKNFGNYPDPREMLGKHGGDALRLYLMGSPVMHAEDIRISAEEYRNQVKGMLLTLWNVYNFFVTYANADKWVPPQSLQLSNVLDRWIISRLVGTQEHMVEKGYEVYDTVEVVRAAEEFLRDLSQWYVRRIRDRVGPAAVNEEDKASAHTTLWYVLVEFGRAAAPLIPFTTEEIYRNLTKEESVHLTDWRKLPKEFRDEKLEAVMIKAMALASAVHAVRKAAGVKVRIPLKSLTYTGPEELPAEVLRVVGEEVNVDSLTYQSLADTFSVFGDTGQANQDLVAGQARELVRQIQMLRKDKGCRIDETIRLTLPRTFASMPKKLLSHIQRETLAQELAWGDEISITTG